MPKFLIQSVNDEIVHDFVFHLKEAIKYNNWFYNEEKYKYMITDNVLEKEFFDYIPVGSIEFVLNFYKQYHSIENIKPINIPKSLMIEKYLKRDILTFKELKKENVDLSEYVFVKAIDKFKDLTDIIQIKDIPANKNVLISPVISIESEWRGFVHNQKLIDMRNYGGDFSLFPDINVVNSMIGDYKDSPKAYTIDVAVTNKGYTVIIEVHHFFSCGLYGFSDYSILPKMFIDTHREILNLK